MRWNKPAKTLPPLYVQIIIFTKKYSEGGDSCVGYLTQADSWTKELPKYRFVAVAPRGPSFVQIISYASYKMPDQYLETFEFKEVLWWAYLPKPF